ncbi:hypothetical protein ABK040_005215 [Willaertia magna]
MSNNTASRVPFVNEIGQFIQPLIQTNPKDTTTINNYISEILRNISFPQFISLSKIEERDVSDLTGVLNILDYIIDKFDLKDVINYSIPVFLLSDLFKLMTHLYITYKDFNFEQIINTLSKLQELLIKISFEAYQVILIDLCSCLKQLTEIYLYFIQSNSQVPVGLVFLPEIYKRYTIRFNIIDIENENKCEFIQMNITKLLKKAIEKHYYSLYNRDLFINVCLQIRLSTNPIKCISLEIINLFLKNQQTLEPSLTKVFVKVVINILQESQKFPTFRNLNFDNILSKSINYLIKQFQLGSLEHFRLESNDFFKILVSSLNWNLQNSNSILLKKELIKSIGLFLETQICDLEILLKCIKQFEDYLNNSLFYLDDLIYLLKQLLKIHYNENQFKRNEECNTQLQNNSKKRKLNSDQGQQLLEGNEVQQADQEEGQQQEVTEINLSFSSNENLMFQFGNNFKLLKNNEDSFLLFEMINKKVLQLKDKFDTINNLENYFQELYLFIISLLPYKENCLIFDELILILNQFVEKFKENINLNTLELFSKLIIEISNNNLNILNENYFNFLLQNITKYLNENTKQLSVCIKSICLFPLNLKIEERILFFKSIIEKEILIEILIENLQFFIKDLNFFKNYCKDLILEILKKKNDKIHAMVFVMMGKILNNNNNLNNSKDLQFFFEYILQNNLNYNIKISIIKTISIILLNITIEDIKMYLKSLENVFHYIFDENKQVREYFVRYFNNWITKNNQQIIPLIEIYKIIVTTKNTQIDPLEYVLQIIENKIENKIIIDNNKFIIDNKNNKSKKNITSTLLLILGSIGSQFNENEFILKRVLLILLDQLFTNSINYEYSYLSLKQIEEVCGKSAFKLYSNVLGNLFYDRIYLFLKEDKKNVKAIVPSLFDKQFDKFIKRYIKNTFPKIILKNSEQEYNEYIKITECKPVDYFEDVIVYCLIYSDNPRTQLERIISLFKISNKFNMIDATAKSAYRSLVFEFSSNEEKNKRVRIALDTVASYSTTLNNSSSSIDNNVGGSIIKQEYHGILHEIKDSIKKKSKAIDDLKSLFYMWGCIIELLGKDIKSEFLQTLTMLTSYLTNLNCRDFAFDVIIRLIKQLDQKTLIESLDSIFTPLIPLINLRNNNIEYDEFSNKINKFLLKLLNDNKHHSEFNVDILPKLPNHLKELNEEIEKLSAQTTFEEKLEKGIISLSNESQRMLALNYLKELLYDNKIQLQRSIFSLFEQTYSSQKNIINRLTSVLLSLCNDSNLDIKLRSAEILGELGAIDPNIINLEIKVQPLSEKTDTELIIFLLKFIMNRRNHHLTEKNIKSYLDKRSFAIQELLKLLTVGVIFTPKKSKDLEKYDWFDKFSQHELHEIITFSSTSYTLTYSSRKPQDSPIFRENIQHKRWISSWAKQLITRTQQFRAQIFKAIRPYLSEEIELVQIILPYLVYNVLLFGEENHKKEIKVEIMAVIEHDLKQAGIAQHSQTSEHAQTIFNMIDDLKRWVENSRKNTREKQTNTKSTIEDGLKSVETMIAEIPLDQMAATAFNHGAHTRALMYYESYLRGKNSDFQMLDKGEIHNLQRIYGELKERDSLLGIAALRTDTTIEENIIDKEVEGNWSEARDLYEILMEREPNNNDHLYHLLKCYKNLGQYRTMLNIVNALTLSNNSQELDKSSLLGNAVQACWRLCLWGDVENYANTLNINNNYNNGSIIPNSFEVYLGLSLYSYTRKNKSMFDDFILAAKNDVLLTLSAASTESYERSYPDIVKLQVLSELERSFNIIMNNSTTNNNNNHHNNEKHLDPQIIFENIKILERNLKITSNSLTVREPLLSLRRCLFNIHNLQKDLSNNWLHVAKLSRKEKQYSVASSAIMHANLNPTPNYHIEHAKLLWEKGEKKSAVSMVSNFEIIENQFEKLNNYNSQMSQNQIREFTKKAQIKAKMKLMYVNWEREHKTPDEIIKEYEKVIELENKWENGYFSLATYLDRLFVSEKENIGQFTSKNINQYIDLHTKYFTKIIENYGNSLKYGIKNIYHSLPRLLTLWLRFGEEIEELKSKEKLKKLQLQIKKLIEELINDLPAFEWAIATSQLISRILHQNSDVSEKIKTILIKILLSFPEQSIWSIGCESENEERTKEMKNVLECAKKEKTISKLAKDILENESIALEGFRELCLISAGNSSFNISQVMKEKKIYQMTRNPNDKKQLMTINNLKDLFRKPPTNYIIIPIQRSTTVELRNNDVFDDKTKELKTNYYPFWSNCPRFLKFTDSVKVMTSKQKPKKVGIMGSDSEIYNFLFKSYDDLRKDNRMMEFNTVINRLLKRDEITRNKRLYLRVFAVVPLSNITGIVEWVENTNILRGILEQEYSIVLNKPNITITTWIFEQIKSKFKFDGNNIKSTLYPKIYDHFVKELKPVLYNYFLHQFPEPTKWFQCRQSYIRTAAVWSMIGQIVGLGDRHCENILIDGITGDTVHVDLAMLFETAKKLSVPEKVPFRLTRNMVDAMGVTGVEGVFRQSCEATLATCRKNKDTLMNVLETFIHDPLVDWRENKSKTTTNKLTDVEADVDGFLRLIDRKLDGYAGENPIPFSVQGQVDYLINEATNVENLKAMYTWWMPYM